MLPGRFDRSRHVSPGRSFSFFRTFFDTFFDAVFSDFCRCWRDFGIALCIFRSCWDTCQYFCRRRSFYVLEIGFYWISDPFEPRKVCFHVNKITFCGKKGTFTKYVAFGIDCGSHLVLFSDQVRPNTFF